VSRKSTTTSTWSCATACNHQVLRLHDPRRFGAVLWHAQRRWRHRAARAAARPRRRAAGRRLFGELLHKATRKRSAPIKQVLLAGDIVVGVGNIYACESLFKAGISPKTPASRISRARYDKLAEAIREILAEAIVQGGSTLRDFIAVNGQSGYFQQTYFVYDRAGVPCRNCGAPVRQIKQGQRSTFYCATCQR
jgi:formamidopyrimidine-DNA glycosylase